MRDRRVLGDPGDGLGEPGLVVADRQHRDGGAAGREHLQRVGVAASVAADHCVYYLTKNCHLVLASLGLISLARTNPSDGKPVMSSAAVNRGQGL
jgi:hypothetical protein